MTVIAIDVGATKVASALVAEDGEFLARGHNLLGGRGGRDVADLIASQARGLIARRGENACSALGVIVPGIYRADRGTVWAPNIPDWDDYPLLDALRDMLGSEIRVVIDSDRAGYILGEAWCGAARGARNAIFLAVGTGIGAGILVDGKVLRGHTDIAGAIGWLALDRSYRHRYASCGCFEAHASGAGLTATARELMEAMPNYDGRLRQIAPTELSTSQLFDAFDQRDPIAMQVFDDAIQFWGMAAANLVSLFNPETIVFGGGVFGPAIRFLDRIGDEARRWAQPISMQQVRLVASSLGGDAGLYGAARLAASKEATVFAS